MFVIHITQFNKNNAFHQENWYYNALKCGTTHGATENSSVQHHEHYLNKSDDFKDFESMIGVPLELEKLFFKRRI